MHYSIEVQCDTDPNMRHELDAVAYCPTDGVLEGGGYYWHFKTRDAWQRVQSRLRRHLGERVLVTTRDTSGRIRVHRPRARRASKPTPAAYRLEVVGEHDFLQVIERDFGVEHRYTAGGRYVFWFATERQAHALRDAFLCSTRQTCSVVVLVRIDSDRAVGGARLPLRIAK